MSRSSSTGAALPWPSSVGFASGSGGAVLADGVRGRVDPSPRYASRTAWFAGSPRASRPRPARRSRSRGPRRTPPSRARRRARRATPRSRPRRGRGEALQRSRSRGRRDRRPARRAAVDEGARRGPDPARTAGPNRSEARRPARRRSRPGRDDRGWRRRRARVRPRSRAHRRRISAATSTFSRTLRLPNTSSCWKVRAMPSRARSTRRLLGDVASVERQCAAAHHLQTGDGVEDRGLAGTVRTDEPGHTAALDVEVDVGHRVEAAEADGQLAGFKGRHCSYPSRNPARSRARASRRP